jgi:(4S)-4-hydroxy-5-phosphonooxypentane-2,3-dione isomerase
MLTVYVQIQVKPELIEPFKAASVTNVRASLREAGIVSFSLLQDRAEPSRFALVEVYRDEAAPLAHKQTSHYAAWRDAVEPMMAAPRTSVRYASVFPPDVAE